MAPRPPGIALVSREVYPFGGGGIGEYIASCARLLDAAGEVTIFTTSLHEEAYRRMVAEDDPRMPPHGVQVVFVPEPDPSDLRGYFSPLHLYSARVLEALRQHYGSDGPRLVEFSDYLGEGAVTSQARRAGDPLLRSTRVAIRLHTTAEVCAILDGYLDPDFEQQVTYELERIALRDADAILWPGGDTLDFYKRFYGPALAPASQILNPFADLEEEEPRAELPRDPAAPIRLLYLGRYERRKGVQDLLRAVSSIESDEVRLTLVGGDTHTAPLGTSMRAQLELVAFGDQRIEFLDAVPRSELDRVIQAHDAVVLPSLWEAWPYVGLEALRVNRPLIATPAGGFTEMVRPDVNGWLTGSVGAEPLAALIERLIFDREAVDRLRLEGLPAKSFGELTDATEIVDAYEALLEEPARWDPPAKPSPPSADPPRRAAVEPTRPPLVSVVIPYYGLPEHVGETVESIFAQTYPRLEVVVVNDGSFFEADWVLGELAARYPLAVVTQMNAGLGAARNFGIGQSRGRYIVPMDADNMLEPTFVERGVELLESQPDVAYVTTWSQFVDENGIEINHGYQPLGNVTELGRVTNVAGDATSVIRRRLFELGFAYSHDLTSFEDWSFYRDLGENGHEGLVIPERLFRYRIRPESMLREIGAPREERLMREIDTHLAEGRIEWT
jgi:glycosyltransferase involved in cell wall biosynthesis